MNRREAISGAVVDEAESWRRRSPEISRRGLSIKASQSQSDFRGCGSSRGIGDNAAFPDFWRRWNNYSYNEALQNVGDIEIFGSGEASSRKASGARSQRDIIAALRGVIDDPLVPDVGGKYSTVIFKDLIFNLPVLRRWVRDQSTIGEGRSI
jgi:hypothetical protein